MRPLFEATLILFLMFLVLRVSLSRRRQPIRLRGGIVGLNVLCGALVGWLAATQVLRADPGPAAAGAAPGPGEIAEAFRNVLPFAGLVLGGLVADAALGALWRRLLKDGSASARATLRRAQFILIGVAVVVLVRQLFR